MGLELVVSALLAAFFFGGLVIPIGLWLGVTLLQRQRLVSGLKLCGLTGVEDAGDEHAEAPVRLYLYANGRRLTTAAVTRGDLALWQVRIPVDTSPSVPFALLREGAARVLPELRDLEEVERLPGLPWGFKLLAEDRGLLSHDLGGRLPVASARLVGGVQMLVQCAFTGDAVVVEVRRDSLTAAGLMRALRRSWRFAENLGAVAGPLQFTEGERPHELVSSSRSGAPVALPS